MYYGLSDTYKTRIKDSQYRQRFLLMSANVNSSAVTTYFDTMDNDFTDSGVSIDDYFCTGDDFRYGESPAATLSCQIINELGLITSNDLGSPTAFLGVETSTASVTMTGVNAYVQTGSFVYTATDSGLYQGSTKLEDGKWFGIFAVQETVDEDDPLHPPVTTENVYAFGETGVVTYHTENGTTTGGESDSTAFMYYKFAKGKGVLLNINYYPTAQMEHEETEWGYTFTEWKDGEKVEYELCPMGVFPISGSRITNTGVIDIQSVPDRMALFDQVADVTIDHLISAGYPRTIDQILRQIGTDTGFFCLRGYVPYVSEEIAANPFEYGTTYRQMLGWLAEYNLCTVHMSRNEAEVWFISPTDLNGLSGTVLKTYGIDDISSDGYVIGMYPTSPVTGVKLTDVQGSVIKYGGQDNPYQVYCNPLMPGLILDQYSRFLQTPVYNPISCTIINAEPWLDIGDVINIPMSMDMNPVYAGGYMEALSDEEMVAVYNAELQYDTVPIMQRTFRWNGKCFADYQMPGSEKRSNDEAASYSGYSTAVSEADLLGGFSGRINSLTNSYGNIANTGNVVTSSESAVSVSSGSAKTLSSKTFTQGVWLVMAWARFASNATGYRRVLLSKTQDSSTARSMNASTIARAVDGANTEIEVVTVVRISNSGETIYMNAVQNSGSALNVTPRFFAVQIA